jgi:preprotein translocase subunit SecF
MNPTLSSMKIETDTFVYIICVAAFIGYTLGIQHAVTNVIKTQKTEQQSNKLHKTTQTNLSELAEILTSNNMMIERHLSNDEVCYKLNTTEDSKNENDDRLVEPKVECEGEGVNSNNYHENVPENVSDNVSNSFGNTNSPEEEFEIVTDSIKKFDTKKQPQYYFGWFDSIF